MENASVARRIYKDIKSNFGINVKITVRNQKRFRVKQIYILDITEKVKHILETLNIMKNNKKTKIFRSKLRLRHFFTPFD